MNKKAEKFNEYLEIKHIQCFQQEEMTDELNTVVFRSTMDVLGQVLPLVVITDDTIYSLVRLRVAANVINKQNEVMVHQYIDKLNNKFKLFKYYVRDNSEGQGDVVIDICLPATDDSFTAPLVHAVIGALLNHLLEEYPVTMKYIWSDWSAMGKTKSGRTKKSSKG